MMLALDASDADAAVEALRKAGETAWIVGRVEAGEKGVTIC